jgi:alpha-N-arabinofuranosidase
MEARVFVDSLSKLSSLSSGIYGQFIEHLGKCIYGGVWVGPDSKIPNARGFRLDVLEAVKGIKPPLVRWPGGNFASSYHWEDGIGPRERRERVFDQAWGTEEPNEFGTCEYIEWVRLVGAEPFIVVNAGNGTAEEAARWVEFCNSRGGTRYARLRRTLGYTEPFNVKLWGVGNELYGRWQVGFCVDGEECARRTVEFVNQMKRADPSIKIVAVGCDYDPEWNVDMVKGAGEYIDYLSIHRYVFTSHQKRYEDLVAWPIAIEENLVAIYRLVQMARSRYHVKREIKLAFDEWNVWYPEAQPPLLSQVTRVKDAVFTGLVLNALQRLSGTVPIACFAQTVNVLPLIIAEDDGRIALTPQYLVFKLYAEVQKGDVVNTVTFSPSYPSGELDRVIPYVDASAVLKGGSLHLYLVNRHPEESARVEVFVRGFTPSAARHKWVAGSSVEDANTLDDPNRVRIEHAEFLFKGIVELPPHSVNAITLS